MQNEDFELLKEVLACPACKGKLIYHREKSRLSCNRCRLYFPVKKNIPILLLDKAEHFDE